MTAKGKLKKAKSSLDKLHFLIQKDKSGESVNSEEIHSELESFLTAMRSVPDHLLEDYNKKYSLGIPLTTPLYSSNFKGKARTLGNRDALNFIDWYETEMAILKNDAICSFLINQRDISIHRKEIKPFARRSISYGIDVLIGRPEDFERLEETKSPEENTTKTITLGWFFTDYHRQDILSMCEYYYGKLKQFVEEARRMFP